MNGDVEQEKWTEEGFYKAKRSLKVTIDGKEYDPGLGGLEVMLPVMNNVEQKEVIVEWVNSLNPFA